jgi:hypothetical protein
MEMRSVFLRSLLVCGLVAWLSPTAHASTFVRASMDDLSVSNSTVVVGEVLTAESYWNETADFILTDARILINEVVKGSVRQKELVVTVLGGTVGDLSVVIPGGAQLHPGGAYVLFLSEGNLPGARGVQTVRDHGQGVFNLTLAKGQLRAVSQAAGHPMLADSTGETEAPGGIQGLLLDDLVEQVRAAARRSEEVQR